MGDTIYLQVCAGLGNRLRATVSGLCAAKDLGREIIVSWPVEPQFGATWNDIFEPQPWIVDTAMGNLRMCLSPSDWETEKGRSHIAIKSYGQFYRSDEWLQTLQSLKPREEYIATVRAMFGESRPVGVHIRRTDNLKSILSSPTTAFFDDMDAYPKNTRFFLATDDPAEYAAVAERYPGRIINGPGLSERHTVKGIKEAFTQFLALSQCSEILGSVASSFSEMAAAYGNILLKRVTITQ
jgi:hypothetical protein